MNARRRAVTSRGATSTAGRVAVPLALLTEKQFEGQVLDLLAATDWAKRYHTYRSKKSPSGFPDEVWARERVIFAELKREGGKPSEAQRDWLRALLAASAEVYLLRPSDLEALTLILSARRRPDGSWSMEGARQASERLTERLRAEVA